MTVNCSAANLSFSVLCGGAYNTNGGYMSMIPGGSRNLAKGDYSFAAGYRAKANHAGSFVWADHQEHDFGSTVANGFFVRSVGGVKLVTGVDSSGHR